MKEIVNLMVNEFNILEAGIDFMGYRITDRRKLSFHHLITSKKDGGKETIENGAILLRDPHDYLHIIEKSDKKIYRAIREQMIIENMKRQIYMPSIEKIDELLREYEEVHSEDTTKGGYYLIKDVYRRRLLTEKDENYY